MRKPHWKSIFIFVSVLIFVVVLMILSIPLLPSGGWSEDVKLSSGSMDMRVQFKTDPAIPTTGPVTLMARVKNEAVMTTRVNQLVFNYSIVGQQFAQSIEGVPVGEFGTQGEGFYTADVELPFPGDWQIEVGINHSGGTFSASFPLKVNQQ